MKAFVVICSVIVSLQCFWLAADARGSRRYAFSAIRPKCQKYRGTFCAKYLKGKKIYLTKHQRAGENRVKQVYHILNGRITDRCMKHSLPTLCYSMLPPCDPSSKRPKKLEICQEDCYTLQHDVCKLEFTYAREYLRKYARNCSTLPARGDPGYKHCVRITMKAVSLSASVQNISMYEGKSVTLKCRLNTKKVPFNITWLKDGAPINSRFKSKKFRWGSRLRVRRVRAEDDGKYQCFIKASGTTIEAVGWLNIRRRGKLLPPVTGSDRENYITSDPPVTRAPYHLTKRPKGNKPRPKYPRCEPYRGKTCADFMRGDMVFAFTSQHIEKIELDFKDTLEGIRTAPHMTQSCRKYSIRALCYHIFKTCDTKSVEIKPKLCRDDCYALYDDVCATELLLAKKDPRIAKLLPNCSKLPTKKQEDHHFCASLGINDKIVVPPMLDDSFLSHLDKSKDEKCYNGTGSDYLGRHNITKSGHPCKLWRVHDPVYNFSHNYCRNPRNHREAPWCYVSDTEYDLCDLPKCSDVVSVINRQTAKSPKPAMTVNRTIYVICSIMGVLIVAFISIILYLKIQHRRNSLTYRDNSSSGSISKSTQSTVPCQPSNEFKQSLIDVKSCCFNVMDDGNQGKVKFLEVLGEGAFARVCKGVLMNGEHEESDFQFAIKRLKSNVPDKIVENFRNETNVLAGLQDINILCLVGVSVVDPYFMVFEYYGDIDLHQFLKQHTPSNTTDDPEVDPDEVLLLDFALQVASGLDYLVEKHFVHRDIACRNCFVTKDNIVKISNLGIGNTKYPADYSWVHGSSLLPVRWMAPEALNALLCTHQSDVWSYGVLLWEIYSYGRQPYTGSNNQEAIERIRAMELLPCPDSCPARIYSLMKECWEEKTWERPSSVDICSRLRAWAGDSIGENH